MGSTRIVPKLKVAICATHPIQYQAPLWRKLSAFAELELKVFYGTDMSVRGYQDEGFGVAVTWDTPLLEGYESKFLSTDSSIQRITTFSPSARGLGKALRDFNPDVGLMVAYRNRFHMGVWRELRKRGVPIVMRHEATDVAHARSGFKATLRNVVLQRFYATISAFGVIGTEARQHLLRLGVAEEKMYSAPYCVDTDFVAGQVAHWLPQRNRLREEQAIPQEATVFAFSGKLIEKKDPMLMLAALRKLAAEGNALAGKIHLVIAGDGQLMPELRKAVAEAGLTKQVHLLGFLNQAEVGRAYAVADALILPSRRGSGETWGLVVNEGMHYGLPALVSDGVGCGPDLVQADQTGWIFPTGDAEALGQRMMQFAQLNQQAREQMRKAVENLIQDYTLEIVAGSLSDAFQSVTRPISA